MCGVGEELTLYSGSDTTWHASVPFSGPLLEHARCCSNSRCSSAARQLSGGCLLAAA